MSNGSILPSPSTVRGDTSGRPWSSPPGSRLLGESCTFRDSTKLSTRESSSLLCRFWADFRGPVWYGLNLTKRGLDARELSPSRGGATSTLVVTNISGSITLTYGEEKIGVCSSCRFRKVLLLALDLTIVRKCDFGFCLRSCSSIKSNGGCPPITESVRSGLAVGPGLFIAPIRNLRFFWWRSVP
jgi:hypothetical protein